MKLGCVSIFLSWFMLYMGTIEAMDAFMQKRAAIMALNEYNTDPMVVEQHRLIILQEKKAKQRKLLKAKNKRVKYAAQDKIHVRVVKRLAYVTCVQLVEDMAYVLAEATSPVHTYESIMEMDAYMPCIEQHVKTFERYIDMMQKERRQAKSTAVNSKKAYVGLRLQQYSAECSRVRESLGFMRNFIREARINYGASGEQECD